MTGNCQLDIDDSKIRTRTDNQLFDGDRDGLDGGHDLIGDKEADAFYAMLGDHADTRTLGAFRNVDGSLQAVAEQLLELGKRQLDGVQVG